MDILLYLIGPLVVVLIIHPIMAALYKDVEKKDKGFVISYFRLTYRRRLLRTLWGIPFMVFLYLIIYWIGDLTTEELSILGAVFLLLISYDTVYNYKKWNENERHF